jgi:hypothetical protein
MHIFIAMILSMLAAAVLIAFMARAAADDTNENRR